MTLNMFAYISARTVGAEEPAGKYPKNLEPHKGQTTQERVCVLVTLQSCKQETVRQKMTSCIQVNLHASKRTSLLPINKRWNHTRYVIIQEQAVQSSSRYDAGGCLSRKELLTKHTSGAASERSPA